MSLAFSRSIRLMHQDSFRFGLAAIITLLVFLSAWVAWFFLARIPIYANSQQYQVTRTGTLQVTFSEADLARILPGQTAVLSLPEAAGNPAQTFKARVMDIPAPGKKLVEVYVFTTAEQPTFNHTATGTVKVETSQVSPATLVMRSTGQLSGKP
ncbi:MAG: hypothetical protein NTW32_21235 [Chloroflexi bacterium]|nr:hypothetical protein [Chloroflexota bacterium]